MTAMNNEELLPEKIRKYIQQHDLHRTVTEVLNNLLDDMPADPFGHLVEVFANKAVEPPCFQVVRLTPELGGGFHLECVVKIRGMRIRPHEATLERALFELLPEGEPEEAEEAEEGEEPPVELLDAVAFADGPLTKAVVGLPFGGEAAEAVKLHKVVLNALATQPRLARPDDIAFAVVGHLLQAGANACNLPSSLGYFQQLLERRDLTASPALRTPQDLAVWQEKGALPWWAFPVLEGPGGTVTCPVRVAIAFPSVPADAETPPLDRVATLAALAEGVREKLSAADPFKDGLAGALAAVEQAAAAADPQARGLLFLGAMHAYEPEEMTYTLHAEDTKTTEELVAFYAETLEASAFVRVVAGPFTRESANAYEELALRLPNVSVLCDFDGANAAAFVAPRKYDGCSYLAEMRSAAGLLEQFERIGEKFAPPVVCSVPAAGAAIPCTLESILALPTAAAGSTEATRYILVNGDGGEGMGTQFLELLAGVQDEQYS